MGMTSKYSRPISDMAEHVDAIINECTCNECMDCCLGEFLETTSSEVSSLETLYDEKRKETDKLNQEIKKAFWSGFEISHTLGGTDIQARWNEYKELREI